MPETIITAADRSKARIFQQLLPDLQEFTERHDIKFVDIVSMRHIPAAQPYEQDEVEFETWVRDSKDRVRSQPDNPNKPLSETARVNLVGHLPAWWNDLAKPVKAASA